MAGISIITDELTQNLDEAVLFAHHFGLTGLEFRTLDDLPIEKWGRKRVVEIARRMKDEGLKTVDLAGSFFKCPYSRRQAETEKLKALLEAADILGSPYIRCFSFLSEEPVSHDQIAEAYDLPLRLAEEAGKTLLLEADPSVTTTNHQQLESLMRFINDPHLQAIFDPGNDLYDPSGEIPYPAGYRAICRHIAHIHIKDAVITESGPECVCPGTGLVDYPGLLQEIKNSGYQGYFSLEPHYRAGRRLSEVQMKLPGGSSFTDGGKGACTESAAALITLVREAGLVF